MPRQPVSGACEVYGLHFEVERRVGEYAEEPAEQMDLESDDPANSLRRD